MAPTKHTFSCEVCSQTFTAKSSLGAHMVKHGGARLPCRQCDKTYSDGVNLNRHMRNAHKPPKHEYRCRGCGKALGKRSDNAKRHVLRCPEGRALGYERVALTAADNAPAADNTLAANDTPAVDNTPAAESTAAQTQQPLQQAQEQVQEQQQLPAYQYVYADSLSPESGSLSAQGSFSSLSDHDIAQLLINDDAESAQRLLDFAKNLVTSSSNMSLSQEQMLLCLEQLESTVSTAPDGSKYAALENLMNSLGMPSKAVSLEIAIDSGAQMNQIPEEFEQQQTAFGLGLGLQYQISPEQREQQEQQEQPMLVPETDQPQQYNDLGFVDFLNMDPEQMSF